MTTGDPNGYPHYSQNHVHEVGRSHRSQEHDHIDSQPSLLHYDAVDSAAGPRPSDIQLHLGNHLDDQHRCRQTLHEYTQPPPSPKPSIRSQKHAYSLSIDRSGSPLSSIVAAAQQQQSTLGVDLKQMNHRESALVTDQTFPLPPTHINTLPQLAVSIPASAPHGSTHSPAFTVSAVNGGNAVSGSPGSNSHSGPDPAGPQTPTPLSSSPVPQLQPSTGSTLGSLPILSPISPLEANSFSFSLNEKATDNWAPPRTLTDSPVRRGSSDGRSAARVLSQLQIQVPHHLSPKKGSFDLESPRLRESSVPRRRTIIEAPSVTQRASPVQLTHENEHLPQTQTPTASHQSEVFEYDLSPSSPSPKPQRRLDPNRSLSSCRDIDAPSQKRSLPPTPNGPSHMSAVETISMPIPSPAFASASTMSLQPQPPPTSPRLQQRVASGASVSTATIPIPVPSTRRPPSPRSFATSPQMTQQQQQMAQQQMPAAIPTPIPFNPRHQSTNSASNLPAIAGLADAGPYPTTAAPPQISGPSGTLAIPNAGGSRQVPAALRQEEVCLECMMRDRDLADVIVQGEGIWERESDAGWDDLKEREHELMRTWSTDHSHSLSGASFEDTSSRDSESSPKSHTSALPDDHNAARKQLRDARRAKREEHDAQIARVGWRGFKWEEGSGGEGFPRGFRGTRPGALTEKGIKNVMTMYPSSSALRYQILQNYLRGQYRLIMDIRAEYQRVGAYPEPEEPVYPSSPTISSHDSAHGASGSKPRRPTQRSMDLGAPSVKAPSISTARSAPIMPVPSAPTLRQSPSTPAGLGSQVTHRSRPKSYYSDREPMPANPTLNIAGVGASSTRTSHYKVPSGSTMPKGGRDSRFYAADDQWSDAEDLWPPASPASGNLRPFSFAVRAGATGQGSEGGHSRRSFFGRFGGSVTSLFTGNTHGGSGSMMDMHLGLEADRRNRTSSYQVHEAPRVVGGLSPSRPPFSSRQSLASSVYLAGQDEQMAQQQQQRERPRSRSVSGSRLTQVSLFDDVDEPPNKKKGFKGLLQKMKPKNKRDRSSTLVGININNPSPRPAEEEISTSTELAPPPPMAYLVNHTRQRSGSSMSVADDNQPTAQTAQSPGGSRSVSAPIAGSSGSGSVSPTSSRFQVDRREEPAGRRRTDPTLELPPGAAAGTEPVAFRRGSAVMEMLTGSSQPHTVLTPVTPVYDEPQSFGSREMVPNGQPPAGQMGQMPAGYRKSKQPSLSSRYSTSTTTVPAIETPDPAASASYLVPHQSVSASPPGTLSPNRHKNLPPLPPTGAPVNDGYVDPDYQMRASLYEQQKRLSVNTTFPRTSMDPRMSMDPRDPRDSRGSSMYEAPTVHRAAITPSTDYFPTASPRYHQAPPLPNAEFMPPPNAEFMPPPKPGRTLQPRASFDVLSDGRNRASRTSTAMSTTMLMPADDPGLPHPMYIQRNAAASTGSFGRFLKGNDARHTVVDSVPQTEDRKERRRGIKSIFGKRA